MGWWTVDSSPRVDAIVDLSVDEAMDDCHEWVPVDNVAMLSDGVTESELSESLKRLEKKGSVASVPGGVTRPHILATSRAVKRLVAAYEEDVGSIEEDEEKEMLSLIHI